MQDRGLVASRLSVGSVKGSVIGTRIGVGTGNEVRSVLRWFAGGLYALDLCIDRE